MKFCVLASFYFKMKFPHPGGASRNETEQDSAWHFEIACFWTEMSLNQQSP